MKNNKNAFIPIVAGVFLATFTISANAKCSGDRYPFSPINNDTVVAALSCDHRGKKKEFKPGAGYKFTSVSVTNRPEKGTLTTHSFGFNYKPKKSFTGNESFTIRVCAMKEGKSGCSTLKFNITVS